MKRSKASGRVDVPKVFGGPYLSTAMQEDGQMDVQLISIWKHH